MWLIFHLREDLVTNDRWFSEFNKFAGKLGIKIIHSGLTRFPYTRLRRAA